MARFEIHNPRGRSITHLTGRGTREINRLLNNNPENLTLWPAGTRANASLAYSRALGQHLRVGRARLAAGMTFASVRQSEVNNFRGAWRRKFRVKAAQPTHRVTTLSAKNDTAAFNRRVARVMARQRARGRAIMAAAGVSTRRHASTGSKSG